VDTAGAPSTTISHHQLLPVFLPSRRLGSIKVKFYQSCNTFPESAQVIYAASTNWKGKTNFGSRWWAAFFGQNVSIVVRFNGL
jgi:hypothetical protein